MRGLLALIQEEIIVLVLVVDLLLEEVLNFFKVSQGVHIGDFVLFRVIVYLVVVEFVVVANGCRNPIEKGLALDEQVSQNVILSDLSQLHNRYLIIINFNRGSRRIDSILLLLEMLLAMIFVLF